MVPAVSAGVRGPIGQAMERREVEALGAGMAQAVANLHDMLKARVVTREPLEELADGELDNVDFAEILAGHLGSPLWPKMYLNPIRASRG